MRNDGPDAVAVRQVIVNDGFATFTSKYDSITRLAADTLKIDYPWIEGEAYEIALLTSTGGTIAADIPVAVESPEAGASFYGLMALLGTYVGVIPVLLGMLWLPLLRRSQPGVIRVLMAFTIGLLVFLIVDALLEGIEVAGQGSQAFGGVAARLPRSDRRLPDADRRRRLHALARAGGLGQGRRRALSRAARGASASASTTSARGSRSAPPTPPARSRSAPCS